METNSITCPQCPATFKRAQDAKMHVTKVHMQKKARKVVTTVAPKIKQPPTSDIGKADIIAVLNVKINALIEVRRMLEAL